MIHVKDLEMIREMVSSYGYEKVGSMIGVSGRTVRRWCNGNNEPSDLATKAIKRMLAKRNREQTTWPFAVDPHYAIERSAERIRKDVDEILMANGRMA